MPYEIRPPLAAKTRSVWTAGKVFGSQSDD
jgi:hypothetical protein